MKLKKISLPNVHDMSVAQKAGCIFYAIIGVSVLLFAGFRLIGYDMPYDENPDYNAPMLTGLLIWFMLLLVVATLALTLWSAWRSAKSSIADSGTVNNIPARRIALGVAGATAAILAVTFACSDTKALTVNGNTYADAFWLRMAGMFIGTSIVMTAGAIAALIFGTTQNRRK